MRGVLVTANPPDEAAEILKRNPEATVKITQWKVSDFDADLSRVGMHRNHAAAGQLFNALACAQCHQSGKEGNAFGPNLGEVVKKYKGDAKTLLQEILEPSRQIEEKYRNVTLALEDDTFVAGLILAEDKDSVTIQDRPAPAMPRKVAESSISERRGSVSIMPVGLLNTLSKEQILDLLAYLIAEGDPEHPAFKHSH
jgi:putative heme-binding domain-containing protein